MTTLEHGFECRIRIFNYDPYPFSHRPIYDVFQGEEEIGELREDPQFGPDWTARYAERRFTFNGSSDAVLLALRCSIDGEAWTLRERRRLRDVASRHA